MHEKNNFIILATCHTHLCLNNDVYNFFEKLGNELIKNNGQLIVLSKTSSKNLPKDKFFLNVPFPVFFDEVNDNQENFNFKLKKTFLNDYELWLNNLDSSWMGRHGNFFDSYIGLKTMEAKINYLLDFFRPSASLIWCPHIASSSSLFFDISKQKRIPTYSLERGFLKDTMMVDINGIGIHSILKNYPFLTDLMSKHRETNSFYRYKKIFIDQELKRLESRPSYKKIKLKNPSVLILGELDAEKKFRKQNFGAELSSPNFENSYEIFSQINKRFNNKKIYIYFKPHPGELHTTKNLKIKNIIPSDVDLNHLLQQADIVMSGNSKTYFLSLLYGKKTINISNHFISNINTLPTAISIEDIDQTINKYLLHKNWSPIRGYRLLDWLLQNYLIDIEDKLGKNSIYNLSLHLESLGRRQSKKFNLTEKSIQHKLCNVPKKYLLESFIKMSYLQCRIDKSNFINNHFFIKKKYFLFNYWLKFSIKIYEKFKKIITKH